VNSDVYLQLGTAAEPQKLYGKEMYYDDLKTMFQGYGFDSAETYMTGEGNLVDTGILCLPLCEKFTMGNRFGGFSGALRIQNDFNIQFRWASTTTVPIRVDVVLFTRRVAVFLHEGVKVINEV
jgi:hypothetical protein